MQIDSSNFDEHVDFILTEIESAHYISFDCEFTGLVTQLKQIEGLFPDHREFYQRIKETALNFSLLQLGLTLFHFHEGEYFPRAYNFYLSAPNRRAFNKVFLAEWDSLAFLARNNMDFSHTFRHGIEYKRLSQLGEEEGGLCNPLEERQFHNQTVFFGEQDREIIASIEKIVGSEQRARVDFKSKRIFDYFRGKYDMSFDKGKKNMERYQYEIRVYPREEIIFEKEQPKVEEQSEGTPVCEKEDVSLQQKKPQHSRTLEVLIDKIIACGKPLVGHFPNLDLGLIYHAFIAPLPHSYQEFTGQINKLFPFIFDTKVISRRLQNKMKSIKVDLKSLYKSCFNKKLLQPYANINYKHVQAYLQADSSHEAGFDSFMTGCAFIGMLNYLHDHKQQQTPFIFADAQEENKILYSKFAGEISLIGPQFSLKTAEYLSKIVIFPGTKKEHDSQVLGEALSKRGTLTMNEDHGQTYYIFDEPQNIEVILAEFKELKGYADRRILACRDIWG